MKKIILILENKEMLKTMIFCSILFPLDLKQIFFYLLLWLSKSTREEVSDQIIMVRYL